MTAPAEDQVAVLIVDDQLPFRSAVRSMLELEGRYDVVGEAASGEEAVELAVRVRPRLILMDVRLPGISGVEATRRIVQLLPGTTVVLMSTHSRAQLPTGHDSCGAAAFHRKEEISPDALDAALAGTATG